MKRSLFAAACGVLAVACSDPTETTLTQLNLNRPVDIAFACHGGMRVTVGREEALETDPIITTAQPARSCEWRSKQLAADVKPDIDSVPGQRELNGVSVSAPLWYGFILQSTSGNVAVARWPAKPADNMTALDVQVLDADLLTPGKNAISVGEDPIAIATDKSGCYEVTANAGSCDLSVLDVNSAVDNDVPPTPIRVDRMPVKLGGRDMRAKPAAMVAEPNTAVVGNTCPVTAANQLAPSGVVYIAYPSCGLVAAVDMSDGMQGRIVAGIQFDTAGVATVLSGAALDALSCPDECNGEPPIADIKRPVALDLKVETRGLDAVVTRRLAIGAENLAMVTVVDLDENSLPQAAVPLQVALENPRGTLGITGVALSPHIGMGGDLGHIDDESSPGGQGQYVYAVATDNTVRVVDVLGDPMAMPPRLPTECDTQIDGRFVRAIGDITELQCFPVAKPSNPPRRLGARGPGIELTGDGVPTSVAIIRGLPETPTGVPSASTLVGYFAIISASTGQNFVVNIDDDRKVDVPNEDDPLATQPVLVMAHQLRDSFGDRALGPPTDDGTPTDTTCLANDPTGSTLNGGPRAGALPTHRLPDGTLPSDFAVEMPGIRQVGCFNEPTPATPTVVSELQFAAPREVRDQAYPDLRSNPASQTWRMTWEGALSSDGRDTSVDGRAIREAQMKVDKFGMRLIDASRPFCDLGVEPFDIVQFLGCNPANENRDCPSGYACYVHPESRISGIGSCMLANEASRLATACRDFLTTTRRYTVGVNPSGRVDSGSLVLLPRKHELYATPLDGCIDDKQCNDIASYVASPSRNLAADPYVAPTGEGQRSHTEWSCQADPLRAPINADPARNKRCVQTCAFHTLDDSDPGFDGLDRDLDCAPGTICVGAIPAGARGTCMESVLPPQSCVNGPQFFDVRASEAFTVIGTTDGYVHPIIVDPADQTCMRDPNANRLQIGRIPLKAPACQTPVNPFTGELDPPGSGFAANPCSETQTHLEVVNNYELVPGMPGCPLNTTAPTVTVQREAPVIKFSNRAMTVHLVDPYHPGDMTCNQDRKGSFDRVSFVVPGATPFDVGYQISFVQKAGFSPLLLPSVAAVYPVKVVRGPSESVWVLDDGDFLSGSISAPSTRGQVFRVESNMSVVNVLQ